MALIRKLVLTWWGRDLNKEFEILDLDPPINVTSHYMVRAILGILLLMEIWKILYLKRDYI